MSTIIFDKLTFASEEEVIIAGVVQDATVTKIGYGEVEYPLTDSAFSLNMGTLEAGEYGLSITLVDGDSAGQIVNETLTIYTVPEELTEEQVLEMAEVGDPTPDFIPDYTPYTESNTESVVVNAGSVTGFWPIETTAQKFPERRNINVTHPDPEVNGSDGLFNSLGRQADLTDEASDSERLVTRSGGQGSAISTTGFTF